MVQKKQTGFSRVAEWLRDGKKKSILVYGALLLAALLLLKFGGTFDRCETKTEVTEPTQQMEPEASLEERLIAVLSKIRGAGKVDVLITYETSSEIVTATLRQTDETVEDSARSNESAASRTTREVVEPATIDTGDGEKALVLYEKEPTIRGVIVVAEGASDLSVRLALQSAVHAATNVPLSCIEVFEMSYGS